MSRAGAIIVVVIAVICAGGVLFWWHAIDTVLRGLLQ
jgi:hypothetical protein